MAETNLIHRAVTVRLYPNREQAAKLRQWQGGLKFVWNATLAWCDKQRTDTGKWPTRMNIQNFVVGLKKVEETKWLAEMPPHALLGLAADIYKAFQNWFNSLSGKRKGHKMSKPQFRSKFQKAFSVYAVNQRTKYSDTHVKLQKLGAIRYRSGDLPEGRLLSSRIFRQADKWYMASVFECQPLPVTIASTECVGIDMGLKTLATIYDGSSITEIPKLAALRKHEKRLKRYQRCLSRRVKGSKRRNKAKCRLAKLHQRIANIRKDYAHKATDAIVKNAQTIKIETLNVKGMMKNHNIAKSVADASMGMFLNFLKYKADWYGRSIVQLGQWEATSKTCSGCGEKNPKVVLGVDDWVCHLCGSVHDRDHNAAKNIFKYEEKAYREEHGNVVGKTAESAWSGGNQEVTAKLQPVPHVETRILKQNGGYVYYSLF